MLSIGKTLCWEFWRENRVWWLCTLAMVIAIGFIVFVFAKPLPGGGDLPEEIFFMVLFIEAVVLSSLLLRKQHQGQTHRLGFPSHLYIRPVSALRLVFWRLSFTLLCVLVFHTVVAVTFRLSCRTHFPILLPGLLLGLTVTWMHAGVWCFPGARCLQAVVGCLAFMPLLYVVNLMVQVPRMEVVDIIHHVSLRALILALGLAYVVAWLGVILDRRNVSLDPTRLIVRCFPGRSSSINLQARLFTPFWTLYRLEMRRKGWTCSLGVGMVFVTLLLLWLCDVTSFGFFAQGVRGTIVLATLGMPLMIGCLVGQLGRGDLKIEPYTAVKPINNSELLRVYLLVVLSTLGLAWAALWAGPLLLSLFFFVSGRTELLGNFWSPMGEMLQDLSSMRIVGISWFSVVVYSWTTLALPGTLVLSRPRWVAIQ